MNDFEQVVSVRARDGVLRFVTATDDNRSAPCKILRRMQENAKARQDATPGSGLCVVRSRFTDSAGKAKYHGNFHAYSAFYGVFYVEDCMDPTLYLVSGDDYADAHGWFLTEFEHLVRIEEFELNDYVPEEHRAACATATLEQRQDWALDNGHVEMNDNGTLVDTESVRSLAVTEITLRVENKE